MTRSTVPRRVLKPDDSVQSFFFSSLHPTPPRWPPFYIPLSPLAPYTLVKPTGLALQIQRNNNTLWYRFLSGPADKETSVVIENKASLIYRWIYKSSDGPLYRIKGASGQETTIMYLKWCINRINSLALYLKSTGFCWKCSKIPLMKPLADWLHHWLGPSQNSLRGEHGKQNTVV